MPTPIEAGPRAALVLGIVLTLSGCDGGPSSREVNNARAFEALLTAVTLKNPKELEKDAKTVEDRYAAGELSEANHAVLHAIVSKARARDWDAAEKQAYEFRKQYGDRGAYFK